MGVVTECVYETEIEGESVWGREVGIEGVVIIIQTESSSH